MINKLVQAISGKSKQENTKVILGLDEVTPDYDSYEFDDIDFINLTDVDIFAAINPAGSSCKKEYLVKPSRHSNLEIVRLDTRYRNALRIALFLGHLNQYYIMKPDLYKQHLRHVEGLDHKIQDYRCINMSEDKCLPAHQLPEGR